MRLEELVANPDAPGYRATVYADGEILRIDVQTNKMGLELTQSLDGFVSRYPMKGQSLAQVVLDVIEGRRSPPLDF